MSRLSSIQNRIGRLLSLMLNGSYLSKKGKIFYPFLSSIHKKTKQEIYEIKKILGGECNIGHEASLYIILSKSVKWFNSKINSESVNAKSVRLSVQKIFIPNDYQRPKFAPLIRLYDYVKENLDSYLIDGYIHGSLSTMDYTGYSDLDTLFIIKNEVFEEPELIKNLEKYFIKSLRFLYEFDPLQHHGHFYLMESDLKFYNQSYLPLSTFQQSTSMLGRGNSLVFYVRNSFDESERRFIDSIKVIRRYCDFANKLNNPYALKGFLSHFMILPPLFFQLKGEYVSKKDSFRMLEEKLPDTIWVCMRKVSLIRDGWSQNLKSHAKKLIKIIGIWNPLFLSYLSKYFPKFGVLRHGKVDRQLLSEIYNFSEYLLKLSGIDRNRLEIT